MGERITLKASDGFSVSGYRAAPEGKARGGVVVIGEVWGVNKWVREVTDRFARHGYLAVAPNLFDRVKPGFESEDYAKGSAYATMAEQMKSFSFSDALKDIAGAVEMARAAGKVGITGYCFGGSLTWRAAHQGLGLSAASGYYGGGIANYIDLEPQVPLEMHYGGEDTGIPLDQVEALKKRHPNVDVYVYAADHGFCNSDRPD
ncbi:MAG TPA: dienelactone hydrolase family protein, partial [Hypericibacter adhaerens]|uniref:dienelactone hydrolase family protein n=1 Tax=Hypericibacter adhaerens TaxID=2602016 RepID=UPI002C869942